MLGDDRMHGEHERGGKILRINVDAAPSVQAAAAGQLRAFIERVERLEEEKVGISDDIKEVYGEMKGQGFDTKAIRTIIKLRKMDQATRDEQEAILDLYMSALGMA